MYYLKDEEKQRLVKKVLRKANQMDVEDGLRGWSWDKEALAPPYEDIKLPMYEVAGCYCPTARDVYLRHVEKAKAEPNEAMLKGGMIHELVAAIFPLSKKYIYNTGVSPCLDVHKHLQENIALADEIVSKFGRTPPFTEGELAKTRNMLKKLWSYESIQISNSVNSVISRQPHIAEDALVNAAIPFVVEQKLDGSMLGFSGQLSADAFMFSEIMMMDVKSGTKRDFHRLTTTGYGLVYESLFNYPVNIGAICYLRVREDLPVPVIERDIHLLDEELRLWLIEQRDEKMKIIAQERDPGVADNCSKYCMFYGVCHPCVG